MPNVPEAMDRWTDALHAWRAAVTDLQQAREHATAELPGLILALEGDVREL